LREIPVLFENNFCIILDKPAGLAVQGGKGIKTSLDTIISEMRQQKPFLVHRLDRDTSGLILVAKTREAAAAFSSLFSMNLGSSNKAENSITKRYLGFCSGILGKKRGSIKIELDVRGKKKESTTFYSRLSSLSAGSYMFSLMEFDLGSGRMHQIRRHLALSGCPLLGDDKYGDFSLNKDLKKTFGLKYMLLHASRLIIPRSPFFPNGLEIEAPTPKYFSSFYEQVLALSRSLR
jgi:23S rRNA pseudouridine955/2504/2580 synthase